MILNLDQYDVLMREMLIHSDIKPDIGWYQSFAMIVCKISELLNLLFK